MIQPRRCMLAVAAAAYVLLLLPHGTCTAPSVAPGPPLAADAYLNANGMPLMMPANRSTAGRKWYYEIPRNPVGLLVMLHRCGRNAEDFWPPSSVCPQCIGMPEGVSISRQALARGYALLAINSFNRTVGSQGRCWSWASDATAVRDIVARFRQLKQLKGLPLFFTGCSSGGSLALRLPGLMAIDGIMPVAIGLDMSAFPPAAASKPEFAYPPVAYIHFADDDNTDQKVVAMMKFSKGAGLAAAKVKVGKFAIGPRFFSDRDPMVSEALSKRLHDALRQLDVLDEHNVLKDDWEAAGRAAPWDAMVREELPAMIQASAAHQLALKNESMLAQAQEALQAAGADLLTIQEVSAEVAAAAEALVNDEDANPNFSDSDGTSSASGDDDPYLSAKLLFQHVQEEIAVAWAHHTNLGEYTKAALMWLERCGQANFANLAKVLQVGKPATLSPVRVAAAGHVINTWRACHAGDAAAAAAATPPPDQRQGAAG